MKVALITGGSEGIGAQLAASLGGDGWKVFLLARSEQKLKSVCNSIKEKGGVAEYSVCDISVRNQVEESVRSLISLWGRVDLLVANAGVSKKIQTIDFPVETIEQIIKVNVLGVIYSIKSVLPQMVSRNSGHIVVVSSIAAYRSFGGSYPYCASKAYLNSFCQGLRVDLKKHNIQVTTICPGFVKTNMTERNNFFMPFLMESSKASALIKKAIDRRLSLYIFPWQMRLFLFFSMFIPNIFIRKLTGR